MWCVRLLHTQTYSVVDSGVSYPAHVLDESCDLVGAAKEAQRLVDEMGAEVVGEACARQRFILPSPFECFAVTVEAAVPFNTRTHSRKKL